MKVIYYLIISIPFIFPCCKRGSLQAQASGIVLETVIKGGFNLPQNENTFQINSDNKEYFLIDVKLKNNTTSSVEFVTHSCSAFGNVVVESQDIHICANICAKNITEFIKLEPNQGFSLPVILQVKNGTRIINSKIRIGFLLLNPNVADFAKIAEVFNQSRDKLENIIWSSPFFLYATTDQPYEIK